MRNNMKKIISKPCSIIFIFSKIFLFLLLYSIYFIIGLIFIPFRFLDKDSNFFKVSSAWIDISEDKYQNNDNESKFCETI